MDGNFLSSSRGVALELTPEVAQELRRRRRPRVEAAEETQPAEAPQPREDVQEHSEARATSNNDKDNDASSVLTPSPPPTRPLIVVQTERLLGYVPKTPVERQRVTEQVQQALWGLPSSQTEGKISNNAMTTEKHVTELFTACTAFHSDTEYTALRGWGDKAELLLLEYPEYLYDGDDMAIPTSQLWKSVLRTTGIPPVDSLLVLIKDCCRALRWKAQMTSVVRQLGRAEARATQHRRQFLQWNVTGRSRKLQELYTVRETVAHKVDQERQRLKALLDARDAMVAQRRGGLSSLDNEADSLLFMSSNIAVNDNLNKPLWLSMTGEGADGAENALWSQENDAGASDDGDDNIWDVLHGGTDDGDDEDVEELLEGNDCIPTDSNDEDEVETSLQKEDDVENDNGLQQKADQDTQGVDKAGTTGGPPTTSFHQAEVAFRAKLEQAQAEEEALREACTTNETRMAIAMVKALEERLQKTDELLESLQEEEWAAEEEEEEEDAVASSAPPGSKSLSLLDQIIAMILSATPTPLGESDQKHMTWKRFVHESTVLDWKEYFGRIPPGAFLDNGDSKAAWESPAHQTQAKELPPQSSQKLPPVQLKQSLGIVDNTDDDWDQWDDWTDDGVNDNNSDNEHEPALKFQTG